MPLRGAVKHSVTVPGRFALLIIHFPAHERARVRPMGAVRSLIYKYPLCDILYISGNISARLQGWRDTLNFVTQYAIIIKIHDGLGICALLA